MVVAAGNVTGAVYVKVFLAKDPKKVVIRGLVILLCEEASVCGIIPIRQQRGDVSTSFSTTNAAYKCINITMLYVVYIDKVPVREVPTCIVDRPAQEEKFVRIKTHKQKQRKR